MMLCLLPVVFVVIVLMVTETSGQSVYPPVMDSPIERGHFDRPAVPIEQVSCLS
jgi:hypothetical protein